MEINSEKLHMLNGISLKRVMRLNCPRGVRSSSHFSPLLVCVGLAALIITHSFISNHLHIVENEEAVHTAITPSVKSATTASTRLILTDKNIKVAETIRPYDWVRDDFFSPHKGKVVTKNERKYKPKAPLRFENAKSESKNLKRNNYILKKDTANNKSKNNDEKSFDISYDNIKSPDGPKGVLNSLLGPNGLLRSFNKDETGSNPGGTLLGLVAAGVKQWQAGSGRNDQVKKEPEIEYSISNNRIDDPIVNESSISKGKNIPSNDVKSEEPIFQKGKNDHGEPIFQKGMKGHGLKAIPVRSNHKANNPTGSVLSNIAPLASVLMKQMVKQSDTHHQPQSLAESLMGNLGPVLLQKAIGRLTDPTGGEDKPNSPVNALMGNLGPLLLQNAIGSLTNPMSNKEDGPVSPVKSLVKKLGPLVLQGVMNSAGGEGRDHADKPISPVQSLFQNLGPAVLQGVMNQGGRGDQEQQPSGFMSIIAKAAPKLLNGVLAGGKARPEKNKKSQSNSKSLSKRVAFADSPNKKIKQEQNLIK